MSNPPLAIAPEPILNLPTTVAAARAQNQLIQLIINKTFTIVKHMHKTFTIVKHMHGHIKKPFLSTLSFSCPLPSYCAFPSPLGLGRLFALDHSVFLPMDTSIGETGLGLERRHSRWSLMLIAVRAGSPSHAPRHYSTFATTKGVVLITVDASHLRL